MRRILAIVILGLIAGGCGTATPASDAAASPSSIAATPAPPTPAPTEPFAIRSGTLPAGRYTTTAFVPTLTFRLDGSLGGLFPDDSDEIAFEASGGVFVGITRVTKVVDPTTRTAVDVPDDLVAWLTAHPLLTVEAPQPVEIAGLAGHRVDVVVTDGSERELFAYDTGNLRLPEGVEGRVWVLPLDGADLTIMVMAPPAAFATALDLAQPLLDSLTIAGGG